MSHGFGFFFGIYAISVNSLYQFRCIGLVCNIPDDSCTYVVRYSQLHRFSLTLRACICAMYFFFIHCPSEL